MLTRCPIHERVTSQIGEYLRDIAQPMTLYGRVDRVRLQGMLVNGFDKCTFVTAVDDWWVRHLERAKTTQVEVTIAAGRHARVVNIVCVNVLAIAIVTIHDRRIVSHLVLRPEAVHRLHRFATLGANNTNPVMVDAELPVHSFRSLQVGLILLH